MDEEAWVEERSLNSNFGRLHAQHVGALTRHLVECRQAFGGDLDLFLVMTIIGERTFPARNAPAEMSHAEFLHGHVGDTESAAINQQSIADYSGIPRETVRRKIEQLIAKGWVKRDEFKLLTATDKANAELFQLTESTMRYLRDVQTVFEVNRKESI
jgi:CRP-like cAMP-binding protein